MHHTRIQLIVENKMNAPQNIYMSLILLILNQRYFQWTGNPEDIVCGVVYQFDPEEWSALDAAESGYDWTPIQVQTDSGNRDVTTYLARKERIDESLKPYTWYLELILCGSEQHGLLEDYCQRIENTMDIPDPVENRGAKRDAEAQMREYRESIGRV